jgi:hypothetical protein
MKTITIEGRTFKAVPDTDRGACFRCTFMPLCQSTGSLASLIKAEDEAGINCVQDEHHYEEVQ